MAILELQKNEVMHQIQAIVVKGSNYILQLLGSILAADGSNVLHMIFQISPSDTNHLLYLLGCKFEAVSSWVLDILLQEYHTHQAEDAANFYFKLMMLAEVSLQGHLFERQVLNNLGCIEAKHSLSIYKLTGTDKVL